MSPVNQPTIDEQIEQREQEIAQWRTWATQLKGHGGHLSTIPNFDGTVGTMANIVTGKAPPTPPSGYDESDPNARLAYLQQQVTLCEELAQRLRDSAGPAAAGQLLTPIGG